MLQQEPQVPLSGELAVYPGPDSWIRDVRPTVSILVRDDAFGPEIEALSLVLGSEGLIPTWSSEERTVTGRPRFPLSDGAHQVTLDMRDADARVLQGTWSFNVDTIPPVVNLAPLPSLSEARLLNVTGSFVEANLQAISVNGFSPIIEGDAFLVQVLLWPGPNEIEARVEDKAGNIGLGAAQSAWLATAPPNESYEPFVHVNRSFRIEFPASWVVEPDFELEPGTTADVLASGPVVGGLRATITVFSRFVGETMNEGVFLTLMANTLLNMGEEANLAVVSPPSIRDGSGRTLSAEFSVLQTLPQGPRSFVLVTGFWSNSVRRVWLLVGSVATERVEEDWHAVQRASETFMAIEPDPPPTDPLEPAQPSVTRAFLVTVGAMVFILAFFSVVLYYRREKRSRDAED